MRWTKNMQPVDFSALHDTIVEDPWGNRQPRDVPYFKATEIAPGTWQVLSDGDYTYVLEGDDEAIVIDTGYGCGNIREFCQSLVPDKPVYRALITHSHFDHTANDYLFDVCYMSHETYIHRCDVFGGDLAKIDWPDDYPVVIIEEGDVINLSGRPLEVIGVRDHALSSLQFLDRKNRILFSGDEYNGFFYNSTYSVEYSYSQTSKLMKYKDAFDTMCAGNGIFDVSFLEKCHAGLKYVLDGHENEGVEFYKPYLDPQATIDELDGKPVIRRRCPNLQDRAPALIAAGYGACIDMNDGKVGFPLMRKLSPDGVWDRELIYDGVRIMYYKNKIWSSRPLFDKEGRVIGIKK